MAPNAYTKNGTKITPDNFKQLLKEAQDKLAKQPDPIDAIHDGHGKHVLVYPKRQTK